MEGNLPPGTLVPGGGAAFDLGTPFHFAAAPPQPQPQAQVVQVPQGAFAAPSANQMQELGDVVKASLSDGEGVDDAAHHDSGKPAAASQWHRVKWTKDMVKLLVSAVAYIDEDLETDHGASSSRRKHAMLKRKGKWRLVSSAMTDRDFSVSPQQCEDKFNDLNKRYKRVTEILGWGTACNIIANPALLDQLSLSGKILEEAKKHLSSKHLHYEEMCSYHNRNRKCLLTDPVLQKSLRMALRKPDGHGKKGPFGYDDEGLLSDDGDENDEFNDDLEVSHDDDGHQRVRATKKRKHDREERHCGSHVSEVPAADMSTMFSEGSGGPSAGKNPTIFFAEIERRRLKIKSDMLKTEEHHFNWTKINEEKDRQMQKMKLENEKMALENERMELELKLMEIEMGIKPKTV